MPARHIETAWCQPTRPSPEDLQSTAYDQPPGRSSHTLLICAAPRTSSKRLARLLLAAGIGVPMEYFKPPRIEALGARFGAPTITDYVAAIRARRTVNGVFASNIQHWQHDASLRNAAGTALFEGATLVRLQRTDRDRQVVSLAAAMLSNNWGFERRPESVYPDVAMQAALDAAATMLEREARGWSAFFADRLPVSLRSDEVDAEPLAAIARIAGALGVEWNRESAERMAALDAAYEGERDLKRTLAELLERRR